MPPIKLRLEAEPHHHTLRLDRFLAAEVSRQTAHQLSRREIRRLIDQGAVYVDRKRVRIASKALLPGAVVEVHLPAPDIPFRGRARKASITPLGEERVLYEDDDLIAVDKPAGLPSQATLTDATDHLLVRVAALLKSRDDRRAPYLALHHRLDRGTSGIVLLAKSRRVNAALAKAFQERSVAKVYNALVVVRKPLPEGEQRVENRLAPFREAGRRIMRAVESDGKTAVTVFRRLDAWPMADEADVLGWVEVRPQTGRTHQIRVHLADAGWPVLGDRLYGQRSAFAPDVRLMLHACRLELCHPLSGQRLSIESPLPNDFLKFLPGRTPADYPASS